MWCSWVCWQSFRVRKLTLLKGQCQEIFLQKNLLWISFPSFPDYCNIIWILTETLWDNQGFGCLAGVIDTGKCRWLSFFFGANDIHEIFLTSIVAEIRKIGFIHLSHSTNNCIKIHEHRKLCFTHEGPAGRCETQMGLLYLSCWSSVPPSYFYTLICGESSIY